MGTWLVGWLVTDFELSSEGESDKGKLGGSYNEGNPFHPFTVLQVKCVFVDWSESVCQCQR